MELEFHPAAFVLGLIGAGISFWMAGLMEASFVLKLIVTVIVGAVCYFIGLAGANN